MKDKASSKSSGNNIILSTVLVMAGLILSKGSGFLRDIFVGIRFSDPIYRDSFTLAFTIPDLVYNLLIGGSIQSAITPSLSSAIASGNEKNGIRAVSIFISFFAVILSAVCVLGVIFSEPLYGIFGNGEQNKMTIHLAASASKWLFPQIIFMMLAALCIGILNAYKRFESTSFGPTIYNICVLIAIIVFAGNSRNELMRTTFGIMLAALVYFIYQFTTGFDKLRKFRFIWAPGDRDFIKLVKRALPILISASVVQLNMLILNYFALKLPDNGNVFALRNASTTWQLPYGIFAVAIGNVMLPSLAELYGKKDYEGSSVLLSSRLKSALFLTIPSAGFMFIMNTEVIKAIFKWNPAYTDGDAARAGQLLAGYSIAIVTQSIVFIMNQAFYAVGRTRIPLLAGSVGLITNPLCCSLLMPRLGALALTLSYSVTSIIQMSLLCILYCRDKRLRPRDMLLFIIKSQISLLLMCLAVMMLNRFLPAAPSKINELLNLAFKGIAAVIVYFLTSLAIGVPESRVMIEKLIKIFKKSQ